MQFENIAVQFESLSAGDRQLILIDGTRPPALHSAEIAELKASMENGSTVLFWGADHPSKKLIESLTGSEVQFFDREATSYLIKGQHAIVRKENNASYYFSELTKEPVSTISIGGHWVEESNLILEACNTDWLKWNYQGEDIKTAKVYRSERETKNPGNVIVQQAYGKGELIVSTIDLFGSGKAGRAKAGSMIKNLGGKFKGKKKDNPVAINKKMELEHVLFSGPFPLDGFERDDEFGEVKLGGLFQGKYWDLASAGREGIFDFGSMNPPDHPSGLVFLSFWMYSPRSLINLLIEPDMPRLDMHFVYEGNLNFYVNGRVVKEFSGSGAYVDDVCTFEGLPLKKGWNHIMIKLVQQKGQGRCKFRFTSTKTEFLKEMDSLVDR